MGYDAWSTSSQLTHPTTTCVNSPVFLPIGTPQNCINLPSHMPFMPQDMARQEILISAFQALKTNEPSTNIVISKVVVHKLYTGFATGKCVVSVGGAR